MGRSKGSKNKSKAEVLTKRTAIPKPTPPREPETTLGEEPKNVAEKSASKMGVCKGCGIFGANSEIDKLCYNCHKDAQGFEFNGKAWVNKKKGRK